MQKTNLHASILIWSIFLSIIISLSFISISTKINKVLRNNQDIQYEIINNNQLNNILNSDEIVSQQLNDGSFLNISDKKSYLWSLYNNQTKTFSFSWNTLENISIQIQNWSAIKYKYDIWDINQEYNILDSWFVSFSGNLNNDIQSLLTIENLWWYSLVSISSDGDFIAPERFYEIWTKIWNKNILINTAEIK